MATFAKSTFNASIYASARPTYPKQLFDLIFRYHEEGRLPPHLQGSPKQNGGEKGSSRPTLKPRWDLALDLGCGTGERFFSVSEALRSLSPTYTDFFCVARRINCILMQIQSFRPGDHVTQSFQTRSRRGSQFQHGRRRKKASGEPLPANHTTVRIRAVICRESEFLGER